MIETALNLIWFALAATALIAVPVRSRQARIALICALALLFPIISISDDLSFDRETLERAAVAVLVDVMILVAMFVALGEAEQRRERRRPLVVLVTSDPRSPPRR